MKKNNVQDWIPIKEICNDGIIKLRNNNYIKLIKVNPINYNLKSDLEKKSILNSYKIFLKTCNFNIEILIQSKREDLEKHINNIRKNTNIKENKYLEKLANENITKKSSTKEYYIIISKNKENNIIDDIIKNELKENFFKIKECLSRCGNQVNEISSKDEIIKILYSFFNTRKNLY